MPFIDWQRVETWIALVIGLPSFFLLFFHERYAMFFVVAIAGSMLVYAASVINAPEFTILSVEKTLTIKNKKGDSATLVRRQTAVANQKGITEFWCGGIGASGEVEGIKFDKEKPHLIEETCKSYRVCRRFSPPLSRGQKFTTDLSYNLRDSFLQATERLIHATDYDTRELVMIIRLPSARKCLSAKAYTMINHYPQSPLHAPEVLLDGREIRLQVRKPKRGTDYVIEWVW